MSSSQNEITEVKNPCKVKVRRGLAKARKSVDENIDVSTAGVYTLELDKFHQETKPNIEIHGIF